MLFLLLAAAMLSVAACATAPVSTGTVFVVVRHAEKTTDDAQDPALSATGASRAAALAAQLQAAPIEAVYATAYRRTQQTAAPVAHGHGLAVRTYDAKLTAAEFAAQLRRDHAAGMILVVGHSNTVPGIVSALCACNVSPIDESVYGGRYDVRIDHASRATLTQGEY